MNTGNKTKNKLVETGSGLDFEKAGMESIFPLDPLVEGVDKTLRHYFNVIFKHNFVEYELDGCPRSNSWLKYLPTEVLDKWGYLSVEAQALTCFMGCLLLHNERHKDDWLHTSWAEHSRRKDELANAASNEEREKKMNEILEATDALVKMVSEIKKTDK